MHLQAVLAWVIDMHLISTMQHPLSCLLLLVQATGTPSNDDASIIEHSTTALEGKMGTPAQNAKSVQDLSGAVNRLSAESTG
jgi:hypothetical protein